MALDPFSIERQFNTGALKPIYLFKGPEHFLHRYCIKKIEKKIKKRGESFLKSVLMPDELEKGQLMDILNTTDLFASKKLLILFYFLAIIAPTFLLIVKYFFCIKILFVIIIILFLI